MTNERRTTMNDLKTTITGIMGGVFNLAAAYHFKPSIEVQDVIVSLAIAIGLYFAKDSTRT
jgi:hypothetical protein